MEAAVIYMGEILVMERSVDVNPDHVPVKYGRRAKLATGFEISVPLFVQTGDKVEIDTRTHEYRKRV